MVQIEIHFSLIFINIYEYVSVDEIIIFEPFGENRNDPIFFENGKPLTMGIFSRIFPRLTQTPFFRAFVAHSVVQHQLTLIWWGRIDHSLFEVQNKLNFYARKGFKISLYVFIKSSF